MVRSRSRSKTGRGRSRSKSSGKTAAASRGESGHGSSSRRTRMVRGGIKARSLTPYPRSRKDKDRQSVGARRGGRITDIEEDEEDNDQGTCFARSPSTASGAGTPALSATGKDTGLTGPGDDDSPTLILPQPIISPRDINRYRVIQLGNGFKAVLVSTCSYGIDKAREELLNSKKKVNKCADADKIKKIATSIFERGRTCRIKPPESGSSTGKKAAADAECTGELVNKFDKKFVETQDDEEGSVMDLMFSAIPTIFEDVDGNANDLSFLDLHDDPDEQYLMKSACAIMQNSEMGGGRLALTIGCGSMYDPPDGQGISELATKVVNDSLNAKGYWYYTYSLTDETTTFHCPCSAKNLENNLRELATTLQDLHAGKSEFIDDIDWMDYWKEVVQCSMCWYNPIDDPRRTNLLYSLAKPNHAVRFISDGNPVQLWEKTGTSDIDEVPLQSAIDEFLASNYTSNSMTLAIKAPEMLDNLQKMVESAFSVLKSHPAKIIEDDLSPFDTPEFKMFYHVECTNQNCCEDGDVFLIISWALPAHFGANHVTKPLEYIRELILDENRGGLCYYLRQNNLVSYVDCTIMNNKFFSMFQVQLELSEQGLKDVDEVIATVFAFIKFLGDTGPSTKIFSDQQMQKGILFHALGQAININHPFPLWARNLSLWLQKYESEELLIGPLLVRKFDRNKISKCLDYLTPAHGNYMLFTCPEDSIIGDALEYKYEPIYKTKYQSQEIAAARYTRWSSSKRTDFALPNTNTQNPLLDNSMCLVPQISDEIIFLDKGESRPYKIWYQQNTSQQNYFSTYIVHIISPNAYLGPEQVVMRRIWSSMLQVELTAALYTANLADIYYDFKSTAKGFLIYVSSWNQKTYQALINIFEEFQNFGTTTELSEKVFNHKKNELLKHFSSLVKNPYLSNWFMRSNMYDTITNVYHWTIPELHHELKSIKIEQLKEFINDFKTKCTCAAFVHGNVSREKAEVVGYMIESFLTPKIGFDRFRVRMLQLPKGERIIRFKSLAGSCGWQNVTNYYQCGRSDVKARVMASLIQGALWNHVYEESRELINTTSACGRSRSRRSQAPKQFYMFSLNPTQQQGILSLAVGGYGTPDSFSLDKMNENIDVGVESFYNEKLMKLADSEFKSWKKNKLENLNWTDPTSLDLNCIYFSTQNLSFRFTERYCKMETLKKITLEDVQCWYRDHMLAEGCNYRKLSIQIYPDQKMCDEQKKLDVELAKEQAKIPPPETIEEWRERRKQLRECTYNNPHKSLHKHKPAREELHRIHLDPEVEGKCDNQHFITDVCKFKCSLFQFPPKWNSK